MRFFVFIIFIIYFVGAFLFWGTEGIVVAWVLVALCHISYSLTNVSFRAAPKPRLKAPINSDNITGSNINKLTNDNILIHPGQKWIFSPNDNSPWPPAAGRYLSVTILDVKEGWVRYDMGGAFRDERMKINSFVIIYRRQT